MSDVLLLLKKRIFHFNILFVVQTHIKIVFFSLNDLIDFVLHYYMRWPSARALMHESAGV